MIFLTEPIKSQSQLQMTFQNIFFCFFQRTMSWHLTWIVSLADKLDETASQIFSVKHLKKVKCGLLLVCLILQGLGDGIFMMVFQVIFLWYLTATTLTSAIKLYLDGGKKKQKKKQCSNMPYMWKTFALLEKYEFGKILFLISKH